MDLKDKTIVITGATQGLGQKMAEVLAGQGARIALVDLDEAKLQETARLCADAGSEAKSYPAMWRMRQKWRRSSPPCARTLGA